MSTTINHGQIAKVDENGNIDVFYPKTFSQDVYLNDAKRSLANFLGSTDISTIGDGTISGAISAVNSNLSLKQNITDNSLSTSSKTVPGAINEVNGGSYFLRTLSNDGTQHGDAHRLTARHNVLSDDCFYLADDDGHGVSCAHAIRSDTASTASFSSSSDWSKIRYSEQWRNCPNGVSATYYYEGADTNVYYLPYPHCFVQVFRQNGVRGLAVCYAWANASNGQSRMWICPLHDNWGIWWAIPNVTGFDGSSLYLTA